MNKVDFGRLVASLRQEIHDAEYRTWTQKKLAEEANLTTQIVGNIEQGRRNSLGAETLTALADALHLTSGERREFFLAASGIEHEKMASPEAKPETVLAYLMEQVPNVHLPAYIIDSYCDIVAVNAAVINLLDLETAGLTLDTMRQRPYGLNMMQFVFCDEAVEYYKQVMGHEAWLRYAYQNMMIFRNYTLRYRATDRFQKLLQALKQLETFRRYWRRWQDPAWRRDDFNRVDHFIDNERIHRQSPAWGKLAYFSTAMSALTTFCDLYLCVYVPVSTPTADTFNRFHRAKLNEMQRVTGWPHM